MFEIFDLNNFLDYLSQLLQYLFIWSNIGLSAIFFLLANKLINASQKFELKQDNLKLRIKKIDVKCKYGVFILGSLSVLSLFRIFQFMLLLCFNIFPSSPFLDIIYKLGLIGSDYNNYEENQLIILATATVSFLSFISSIIGLYSAIFKKLMHATKTKGLFYFIGFFVLTFFFGMPLMLSFISPNV